MTISYGSLTNDELLAFYAFVEPDNPWDSVIFTQVGMKVEVLSCRV